MDPKLILKLAVAVIGPRARKAKSLRDLRMTQAQMTTLLEAAVMELQERGYSKNVAFRVASEAMDEC